MRYCYIPPTGFSQFSLSMLLLESVKFSVYVLSLSSSDLYVFQYLLMMVLSIIVSLSLSLSVSLTEAKKPSQFNLPLHIYYLNQYINSSWLLLHRFQSFFLVLPSRYQKENNKNLHIGNEMASFLVRCRKLIITGKQWKWRYGENKKYSVNFFNPIHAITLLLGLRRGWAK